MLTLLRSAVFTAAVLAAASTAAAQGLSLSGPSLAPQRESLTVRIDGRPRPDPSTFTDKARWVVVARSLASPAGIQVVIKDVATTQFYEATGLIRISFEAPVASDVDAVDVIALTGKLVRVTWSQKKPQGSLGVYPVDKREKADVYLFGSWVSGPDVSPTYSVDLSIGAPVRDFTWAGSDYRASANVTMKSSERRDVDPDSYLVAAKLGRIYPIDLDDAGPYLDFQWDVARLEFSRKDSFSNLITAPGFVFSKALYVSLTKDKLVRAALDAEILGAIEAGRNMQAKDLPDGYGAIFRLAPGVALYASFPGALGFEEVRWTTTYRARVLTTKEPFTDVRDDDNPFPSSAKGTRHGWKDQLDFNVTPLLSLTFTHEFGSAPPAFKILDHRYMLGVSAMWSWKK